MGTNGPDVAGTAWITLLRPGYVRLALGRDCECRPPLTALRNGLRRRVRAKTSSISPATSQARRRWRNSRAPAYALQEAGLINLLQKRVRPNVYAYIAQRRCPPHASCEDQDEFSKSAPSPCPSPEPAAATRGRVNAPVAPEAKALHALEVRLNRDLLEAREKLAKTVAGSSAHMKLERFIDQCGRALRFVHNELA